MSLVTEAEAQTLWWIAGMGAAVRRCLRAACLPGRLGIPHCLPYLVSNDLVRQDPQQDEQHPRASGRGWEAEGPGGLLPATPCGSAADVM